MNPVSQHLLIHRLAEDEKLNATQIAGKLNISAKTVRRHLKKERYSVEQPRKIVCKLDAYKERIKELLERQSYTAAQLFHMMREEGYCGCESVLRDFVAKVRPKRQAPYLTLHFEPGQTAQVDFADCGFIHIGECRRKLYAFVMVLGYSRMMFVKFILRQSMEHFLAGHREAFEYFHGVSREIMVDNCKAAVVRSSNFGVPDINQRYADCAVHYGFNVRPCGVRKANEKGAVERSIGYLRTSFLNGLDLENTTLAALNHGVRQWMDTVANVRVHSSSGKIPDNLFSEERRALRPLPTLPYDCGVIVRSRADRQYRVTFESNRYSVPPEFAGKRVELHVYPEMLQIRQEGKIIAEHERCYEHHRDFGLPEHDHKLLEQRRKARYGIIMKQFLELGSEAENYYRGLQNKRLNPGLHVRKIVALLSVYGRDPLLRALADAATAGAFGSDYIANLLEVRGRPLPEAEPLHLSRKSDMLDLEIQTPDLNLYDVD